MLPAKYEIGVKVVCTGYIKPSGNYFAKDESASYPCYELRSKELDTQVFEAHLNNKPLPEGLVIEEDYEAPRFKTINKQFTGICVGETIITTMILCSLETDYNWNEVWRLHKTKPDKFYVVYFGNNKKRLVPVDMCELEVEENG